MSENPPEGPNEPQPPEPDKGDETGFAVYDLTLKRFVGRVHPTKGEATKGLTKVEGHKYETRKV